MKGIPLGKALLGLALSILATGATAAPPVYPSKPIRLLVGYPPGGTTDLLARALGQQLMQALKQPVAVENKPGAGGGLGANQVARAEPDGYTLGVGSAGNLALNYATYANIPYDSQKDLTALSLVASVPNVLVVNPATPAKTVQELIAYLKNKKGGGFFASTGTGNGPHLTGELFKARTSLNLTHVPYQGGAPAITALLGGEVDLLFDNLPSALPFIQSGKLRALAVTSAHRAAILPDVQTMQEAGIDNFQVDAWFALFGPAAMDPAAVAKIGAAVRGMSGNTAFLEALKNMGTVPELTDGAALSKLIDMERERWPALVKQAGIKRE